MASEKGGLGSESVDVSSDDDEDDDAPSQGKGGGRDKVKSIAQRRQEW